RLRGQLAALQQEYGRRLFEDRLARTPAAIREDVRTALNTAPARRTEVQKYLAAKFAQELRPPLPGLVTTLLGSYPEFRARHQRLQAAVATEEAKRRTFAEIRAFYDLPGEAKTPLLRRGDYLHPGSEVRPGTPSAPAAPQGFTWKPPAKEARTSG